VADETEAVKPFKQADESSGIGVDVVGKNVFVDRPPGRSMDRDKLGRFYSNGQVPQEFPPVAAPDWVRIFLEAPPGPIGGLFRPGVKIVRLVENGKIVVPHDRRPASGGNQIEALHGIGPVSDDIAQANNVLDLPPVYLLKDRGKRFKVPVNIADNGKHGGFGAGFVG
jgi:hypothetical protein